MRRFKKWAALLGLLLIITAWLVLDQGNVTRSAKGEAIMVRDGDTLSIAGLDHRLHGIDAPEYRQSCQQADGSEWPCGKEARAALAALTKGKTLICEELARDKYQRVVARCLDGQKRDIAQIMARSGMAISLSSFVEGPYAQEAQSAQDEKRGLWQGRFVDPAIWRKAQEKAQP